MSEHIKEEQKFKAAANFKTKPKRNLILNVFEFTHDVFKDLAELYPFSWLLWCPKHTKFC